MLAVTRKSEIKDLILEKKSVTVIELARMFSVTEETIRRDLKQLEEEGFLTRTYGGAFIHDGVENNVALSMRETIFLKSKQAIANQCRQIIHNGDSIFLDSSTTTLAIAKAISDMRLTVVTNSLLIVNELCDIPNIHLVCIGGNYTSRDKAFNGLNTTASLSSYYLDKTFMSCRSLSMEHGITDSLESVAAVRQSLVSRSKDIYLVADFSKFDKTSFIYITDFDSITGLVTDRKLNSQWLDFLAKHDVNVYEARSNQPENKSWTP